MVSRERLLRLGATVAEHTTTKRVRVVGQLLLVAGLAFVVVRLRSIWHDSSVELAGVDWLALAGAFVVAGTGVIASAFIWLAILERLGAKTRRGWTSIFFQAQLAKYIPGSLWQYAGRATLASARGLPVRPVTISLPVELGASLVGAAALSALLLGGWGVLIAAAVLVALVLLSHHSRSAVTPLRVAASAGATGAVLYIGAWFAVGAGFWLTANALLQVPFGQLLFYVGAFTGAWVIGLLAIYAPGGIGVREAILVAVLRSRLGSGDALVLAGVSRALMTILDIALTATAVIVSRARGQRVEEPEPALRSASAVRTK
jgi:uncharacterized membrane protein YbhN (UPF0104 family)